MKVIIALCTTLFMISTAYAAVPYCKTSLPVDPQEDVIIQKTVDNFSKAMKCEVGNNCVKKLGKYVYSIAWKTACGPVIDGIHQLGDNGHGSMFECGMAHNVYCCWPKGYQKDYLQCAS